ncbi:MAG: hypothetical protein ACLTAF_12435 [Blautia coccoides]
MKPMIKDDASQIAKIMTDGCNMESKPYGKDQLAFRAARESISLARHCQMRGFPDDLKQFL